jgi:hypothetical protein
MGDTPKWLNIYIYYEGSRNARVSSGVLLGWHKCNFFDSKIVFMPSKRT